MGHRLATSEDIDPEERRRDRVTKKKAMMSKKLVNILVVRISSC